MLSAEDSYFFDQAPFRQLQKRSKKSPDELPQSLRYAHLNPKLASFYKESKSGEEDGQGDDGVKDSILPEISNTFATIRNQLLSGFVPDFDSTRLALYESKAVTPMMLEELGRLLPLASLSNIKLTFPRSLDHSLQSTYDELIYDAKYVKRQWQLLENQVKFEAEEKEKMQKEGDSRKSKLEGSESEEDLGRGENTEPIRSRLSKSQQRRKRQRNVQSQPTVVIEESSTRKQSSRKKSSRANSGIRKPATAPGKPDGSRLTALKAGEEPPEGSPSARSGHPTHSQPYSMTVLAFNLSNYQSWENKGCHVFGIDREESNDHPLEWVVKRLNHSSSNIKLQQEEAARRKCDELAYTRYYSDAVTEKSLAKTAGDRLGIFNMVMKGGRPKVPSLKPKPNKNQVLCTQITDGSKAIYYDNGDLAIVTSRGPDVGFYTLAYDKDEPRRMLASFTPQGIGSCYTAKNTPLILVTESGGLFTNSEEDTEEWTWPEGANTKLTYPITVPLNKHISIKIVGRSQITLTFQSGNHFIKINLGLNKESESVPSPSLDELFPLQMNDQVVYTSNTAQNLIQRQKLLNVSSAHDRQPTGSLLKKSRGVKTPKKEEGSTVEFSEAPPSSAHYDMNKVQRDYGKLKNKAKNLVDEWLDLYRVALGVASPQLKNMKPSTDWSRQGLHTAKSLPPNAQNDNADELASTPIPEIHETDRSPRIPSAPSDNVEGFGPWMLIPDNTELPSAPRLSSREKNASNTLRVTTSGGTASKLSMHKEKSTIMSTDSPKLHGLMSEWTVANHYQCPVMLRHQLLGYNISGAHNVCKCNRRHVPYITDVELETFISQIVPKKQLVILSVVSSLYPEKNVGDELLDRLHNQRNANRAHVCMQSRADPYRVFRYDVVTAYFDSDHSQPLLLSRHNAVPGMFLIFQAGRLIFCDHIFNGYGNAQKDFQKQLLHCRALANRGFSLPRDFKFSPQRGREGLRSPWGGQIGGTGVDKHGSAGVTVSMPAIDRKDGSRSPDSVSTLEYQLGKNLAKDPEEDNVHTSKTLVRKLTKKYTRFVPPAALVK